MSNNDNIKCWRCKGQVELILTPEIMHYGKYVCKDCGFFVQWAKNPNPNHEHLMTGLDTDDPIINFGKHKGKHVSEVPLEYLNWIYHEDFPEPVIEAVDNELTRRELEGD